MDVHDKDTKSVIYKLVNIGHVVALSSNIIELKYHLMNNAFFVFFILYFSHPQPTLRE